MIAPAEYAAARQVMVEIVCSELEEYATQRDAGRSMRAAGLAMGISRDTAATYEQTISTLLAALETETAPAATGAAESTREETTCHVRPYRNPPQTPDPHAGRGDRPASPNR